jgi:hypothetical protein
MENIIQEKKKYINGRRRKQYSVILVGKHVNTFSLLILPKHIQEVLTSL